MEEIHIMPCQKGWKNMTPRGEGRFCDSCSKVVIDFTRMTNEEIHAYFQQRNGQHVCGHYRSDQVMTSMRARRQKRWGWALTLVTLLFGAAFVSSCRKHVPPRSGHYDGTRVYDFSPPKENQQTSLK